MPWLNSFGRVGSTISSGSSGLEKLEDRIAVAATATLAASGLIFDTATTEIYTDFGDEFEQYIGSQRRGIYCWEQLEDCDDR